MTRLILYGTEHCHLCEIAEDLVRQALAGRAFSPKLVLADIADDAGLSARYGLRIPVLHDPASGRELDWPFDGPALASFLDSDRSSARDLSQVAGE